MTKNNAFKKKVREYMGHYNVSYSEALRVLNSESYLQGSGAITLIVGATGTGKTTALQEMLSTTTFPTAVLNFHKEEHNYLSDNDYVGVLQNQHQLQELVAKKKYSQFAFDDLMTDIGSTLPTTYGTKHFLDVLPEKTNLIFTFPTTLWTDIEEPVESILRRLDKMELSTNKLSPRVKHIRYLRMENNFSFFTEQRDMRNRLRVTDYYL